MRKLSLIHILEQQNTVTDDNRMILRTENLVKKYGKRTVVSHVSFDVKQGEKMCIRDSCRSGSGAI